MNNRLSDLLLQIVELLNECGWHEKAQWFLQIKDELACTDPKSPQFKDQLTRLYDSLGGMGSFSDLPLQPQTNKLSYDEAQDLQWNLAINLGGTIRDIIKHL